MNNINISKLRFDSKEFNPLLLDYKIANDIIINLVYESYFNQTISFGGDIFGYLDTKYDQELHYLRLDFLKYNCSKETISELINSLNKNNYGIRIKIDYGPLLFYSSTSTYLALLSITDGFGAVISMIRVLFSTQNNLKSTNNKWVLLPILYNKVFITINDKESELLYELNLLNSEFVFIPNKLNIMRLIYLLKTINSKTGEICINKIFKIHNNEQKSEIFASIFENKHYKDQQYITELYSLFICNK